MTYPRRLLESEPEGLERELLECGLKEQVPERSRQRIWAGVAAGTGVALPGVTDAASAAGLTGTEVAGGAGAAAGGAATLAAKAGVGKLLTWIGLCSVGGAVVLGGGSYALDASRPVAAMKASVTAVERRATGATLQLAPAPTPMDTASAQGPAGAPTPGSRSEPRKLDRAGSARRPEVASLAEDPLQPALPSAAPVEPSTASNVDPEALKAEIALLDSARRALRSGDSKRAERELREHSQRFSSGLLALEADVLRMESLLARGDRQAAAAAARNYLKSHPQSPHAARVRAVLAAATE
jgi:hypothetical protein